MDFFKTFFGTSRSRRTSTSSVRSNSGSLSKAARPRSDAASAIHALADHFEGHEEPTFGDDEAGQFMQSAWDSFEELEGERAQEQLIAFGETFVRSFGGSNERPAEFYAGIAHPILMLMGLRREFRLFVDSLRKELTSAFKSGSPVDSSKIDWIVPQLLEVCARFPRNRDVLKRTSLWSELLLIMRVLLGRCNHAPQNAVVVSEEHRRLIRSSFGMCTSIAFHFFKENMDNVPEFTRIMLDFICCVLEQYRSDYDPETMVEQLRFVSRHLHLCRELVSANLRSISVLIQAGAVDTLISFINREVAASESAFGAREALFEVGLASLQLLFAIMCRDSTVLSFSQYAGHEFNNFVRNLATWTAVSFADHQKSVSTATAVTVTAAAFDLDAYWNVDASQTGASSPVYRPSSSMCVREAHLDLLFDDLRRFSLRSDLATYPLQKRLIAAILPLLTQRCSERVLLQHYLLQFVSEILAHQEGGRNLFTELDLRSYLLSKELFVWSGHSTSLLGGGQRTRAIAVVSKDSHFVADGNRSFRQDSSGKHADFSHTLQKLVASQVLDIIVGVCSVGNFGQEGYLLQLLDFLQFSSGSEEMMLRVLVSLHSILRFRYEPNVHLLLKLGCFALLIRLALCHESIVLQRACLCVAEVLLTSASVRIHLLNTKSIEVDALFSILTQRVNDEQQQSAVVRILVSFIELHEHELNHSPDRDDLLSKYIQMLSTVNKSTVMKLLLGVKTLANKATNLQLLLCTNNVFLQLVSALNIHENDQVCDLTLEVLQALLCDNQTNREMFDKEIGFGKLNHLILRCYDDQPLQHVFALLVGMMMDEHHPVLTSSDNLQCPTQSSQIANPGVLELLFHLLPYYPEDTQLAFFAFVENLARTSTMNCVHMCASGVIDSVIVMFDKTSPSARLHDRMLALLRVLGRHSISVRQLKSLLQLARHQVQSHQHSRVLKCIRQMAVPRPHSCFLYFDGVHSGLQLPPLSHWPSAGYTFNTAFRVEAFPTDPSIEPRLLSVLTRDGRGLEVFLRRRTIVVRVCLSRGRVIDSDDIALVGHFRQRSTGGSRLFGTVSSRVRQSLRASARQLSDSVIGGPAQVTLSAHCWTSITVTHACGGTFSKSELIIYVDGEAALCCPLPYPNVHDPFTQCFVGTDAADNAFFGQIAFFCVSDAVWKPSDGAFKSFVLAYDARAAEGDCVLDIGEGIDGVLSHAKRLFGTHRCLTTDVRDSLHCLGGIAALLPYLSTVDDKDSGGVLVQVLQLIRILDDHDVEAVDSKGYGIISQLLSSVPATALSPEVVDAVHTLCSGRHADDAAMHLAFNSSIFLNTPMKSRSRWVKVLKALTRDRPQNWHLQLILDNIYALAAMQDCGANAEQLITDLSSLLPPLIRTIQDLGAVLSTLMSALQNDHYTCVAVALAQTLFKAIQNRPIQLFDMMKEIKFAANTPGSDSPSNPVSGIALALMLVRSPSESLCSLGLSILSALSTPEEGLALLQHRPRSLTPELHRALSNILSQPYSHQEMISVRCPGAFPALLSAVNASMDAGSRLKSTEHTSSTNSGTSGDEMECKFVLVETTVHDLLFLASSNVSEFVSAVPMWPMHLLQLCRSAKVCGANIIRDMAMKLVENLLWSCMKTSGTGAVTFEDFAVVATASEVAEILSALRLRACRDADMSPTHQPKTSEFNKVLEISSNLCLLLARRKGLHQSAVWNLASEITSLQASLYRNASAFENQEEWRLSLVIYAGIIRISSNAKDEDIQAAILRLCDQVVNSDQHSVVTSDIVSCLSLSSEEQMCACIASLLEEALKRRLTKSIRKLCCTFPTQLACMLANNQVGSHFLTLDEHVYTSPELLTLVASEVSNLEQNVPVINRSALEKRSEHFARRSNSAAEKAAAEFVAAETHIRKLETRLDLAAGSICQAEKIRRDERRSDEMKLHKLYSRTWRSIARDLTNERGPWSERRARIFWRLASCENRLRMRTKLTIDYEGTDYRDATTVRDDDSKLDHHEITEPRLSSWFNRPTEAGEIYTMDEEMVEVAASGTVLVGSDEKTIHSCSTKMVSPTNVRVGVFELSTKALYFVVDGERRLLGVDDRMWMLSEIREVHFRRYQLRPCAMEIFFRDQTNCLFAFDSEKARKKAYSKMMSLSKALTSLSSCQSSVPAQYLKKSGLTLAWQRRQISNFEYLMRLNTIAGRTYNDLTQYPVFPWIIADYESESLDLKSPKSFRDLSKPVGALNSDRLKQFLDRYHNFSDEEIPPFHYGTHYSNSGSVLFYLIRLEPFTSCGLSLQGNRFDHADRLFDSISQTWKGVLTNNADVKELIPEFFYMPEFLRNLNGYDLGVKQTGQTVNDVVLPPWAHSPEEFVRINREALESEYVSEHLHEWIDLIFGFKQRGPEAEAAHNVFFHLTYEGSVDIDAIEDPIVREATVAQITHFGQTPSQLLTSMHPKRHPSADLLPSLFHHLDSIRPFVQAAVGFPPPLTSALVFVDNPLVFIHIMPHGRVLTLSLDRRIGLHRWKPSSPFAEPAFFWETDKAGVKARMVPKQFACGTIVNHGMFAVSNDGRSFISSGHFDGSVTLCLVESGRTVQCVWEHRSVVTCVALDEMDPGLLATGSQDSTVAIWEVQRHSQQMKFSSKPRHVLRGHDDEVTCVALSCDYDIVASGSKDGTCIVHSVRSGEYIRTIRPFNCEKGADQGTIDWIGISTCGEIATFSSTDLCIHLYTINGTLLRWWNANERLCALQFSRDGSYLVTGGDRRVIRVYDLHREGKARTIAEVSSRIRCMCLSKNEKHLLVGVQSGHALVFALDMRQQD